MAAQSPFKTTLNAPCVMDCAICMAFLREMTGAGVLILREGTGKKEGFFRPVGIVCIPSGNIPGEGGGRMGTNVIPGTLLHLKKEQQLQDLILIFLTGA